MSKSVSNLLKFNSDKEKLEFIGDKIQLDILLKLKDIMKKREVSSSELANRIGVSNSFVSQLFSGDKKLNINHLAAIVFYFNVVLDISIKDNERSKLIQFNDYLPQRPKGLQDKFCVNKKPLDFRPKELEDEKLEAI